MRVLPAGASGVIGRRLLPLLVAAGHTVAGMTRSSRKAQVLRALGAEPVVCDVFDGDGLRAAVVAFAPDVVLHELTDLPDDPARLPELAAAIGRIRREGTRNLLAAAEAAGAKRFVAQSVAWPIPGDGGAAVEEHERAVLDASGVVVRYGRLYGPGTYFESELPPPPRVHVDDAAGRAIPALTASSGVLVITDDRWQSAQPQLEAAVEPLGDAVSQRAERASGPRAGRRRGARRLRPTSRRSRQTPMPARGRLRRRR